MVRREEQRVERLIGQVLQDDGGSDHCSHAEQGDGQGLTHGVMGAMLNTGLILGKDHPWKEIFAPGRVPLKLAIPDVFTNYQTTSPLWPDVRVMSSMDELNEMG